MISFASMWAIVLRHMRLGKHDPNIFLFMFYWPVLDILIWGFLGAWIQQSQVNQFQQYGTAALLGILLWQVVSRGANIILTMLNEELWSHNVVNLFSLPLHLAEWIGAVLLFYLIMIGATTAVCMLVMQMFYDVSFGYVLSTFLLFFPPLFFSALWVGFTGLQIVVMLGKRGVESAYVVAWFLAPFSGAYYPIEMLPHWAQVVSSFLPMSYVLQGLRVYVMYQQDPTPYLFKGYVLGILYAMCAIVLFVYCFNRSKQRGLAWLMD